MKELTCIVIGGGYAGIHAVRSIMKVSRKQASARRIRLVLIDKQPYHLRKVLLFKRAANDADITIPLKSIFPHNVEVVQGTVTAIQSEAKRLQVQDPSGKEVLMDYDLAVVAAGSIVRQPDDEMGGVALTGVDAANKIRTVWRENLRKAVTETDPNERRRLLTIAVAGAGISGIESSAELACAMREEASRIGIKPEQITVVLLNAQDRLFPSGPLKVGRKLERILNESGVEVVHRTKAVQEKDGKLLLSDGRSMPVGLCVWTLGLLPNPMLGSIGLPLTPEGQVVVDHCYRVQGMPGVYSIGDCARILDPASGKADQKTCKEGTAQAMRLGKIISADLAGRPAPAHKGYIDFFCFGLGPEKGMVWARHWGLNIMIAGKLGWKIRKLTWDLASLVK